MKKLLITLTLILCSAFCLAQNYNIDAYMCEQHEPDPVEMRKDLGYVTLHDDYVIIKIGEDIDIQVEVVATEAIVDQPYGAYRIYGTQELDSGEVIKGQFVVIPEVGISLGLDSHNMFLFFEVPKRQVPTKRG